METLERSRVCRLCGKHPAIAIDIFDKRGNHVKKINSVLPILVHEMDLLPKHICHPCNYKLQEFHKFYEDCLKTDASLKAQLSWMRGSVDREEVGVPMVQINNFMIKAEPPDYEDEDTTEAILQSENLANYDKQNCTSYPERLFPQAGTRCSRCGCYCGNRNRVDGELAKTRTTMSDSDKDGHFASRDTIRRNLFATEIFGDKNPRIQTNIPIGNIPQGIIGNEVNAMDSRVRVKRLDCPQNGGRVASDLKMADGATKMSARSLRPRKTCSKHPPKLRKESQSNKEVDGIERNDFVPVAIKVEASEDFERSLRPRIEAIDYAESKRKSRTVRTADTKRPKTCDNNASVKVQRETKKNTAKYSKITDLAHSTMAIKVEPEDFTERDSRTLVNPKNSKKKPAGITFEEFLNSSIVRKISAARRANCNPPKSRVSESSTRRKNLLQKPRVQTAPYLRSQRSQLRNGKLIFDSVVEKPKNIQNSSNLPRAAPFEWIKREKLDIDERPQQIFHKHRDCDTCKCRFASAELYMLHDCYANKRH